MIPPSMCGPHYFGHDGSPCIDCGKPAPARSASRLVECAACGRTVKPSWASAWMRHGPLAPVLCGPCTNIAARALVDGPPSPKRRSRRDPKAYERTCPTCNAKPGERCTRPSGWECGEPHASRRHAPDDDRQGVLV